MKFIRLTFGIALLCLAANAASQTAITYQGQLLQAGEPFTGTAEFQFWLYDQLVGGSPVTDPEILSDWPIENGLFQVELDFGEGAFSGGVRYLEILVDDAVLTPRQKINPVPLAIHAVQGASGGDTLGELDCAEEQVVRFDGTNWVCSEDEDTTYSAGDALTLSGTEFSLASNHATLERLGCLAEEIPRFSGSEWVCSQDETGGGDSISAGAGLLLDESTLSLDTNFTDGLYWRRGGNAGTDPASDFLGTMDAAGFEIRANSFRALAIEPSTDGESAANLIGGHQGNSVTIGVVGATISGGGTANNLVDFTNGVAGNFGTVGGGLRNSAGVNATVGGGFGNFANENGATVGGGTANTINGQFGVISGGQNNLSDHDHATIGGGNNNETTGIRATIAGGQENIAAINAMVGGGVSNTASGDGSAVLGGGGNVASGEAAAISGGSTNVASGDFSFIGGGFMQEATGAGAAIGSGVGNKASGLHATIAGGNNNDAAGEDSFIGGGKVNIAGGGQDTVGGGASNTANGGSATVAGGSGNTASGGASFVGGGVNNHASGLFSTVAGGSTNCAGGWYSWAGGKNARVRPGQDSVLEGACNGIGMNGTSGDAGTFIWGDNTPGTTPVISTGPNQFIVRASGGVWFGTNSAPDLPSGRFINTSTGAHLTSGGTWTNASSRELKTAFSAIDPGAVLARVIDLPLARWRYRDSPDEGIHLGPVAEDFHAAFGLGSDGRTISSVDASGVAFAAIQGLNEKLEAENAELRARLNRLEALLLEQESAREDVR